MPQLLILITIVYAALPELFEKAIVWLGTHFQIVGMDFLTFLIDSAVDGYTLLSNISTHFTNMATYWAQMPPTVIYIGNLLQLPQALSIILSALVARFTLKMIKS